MLSDEDYALYILKDLDREYNKICYKIEKLSVDFEKDVIRMIKGTKDNE